MQVHHTLPSKGTAWMAWQGVLIVVQQLVAILALSQEEMGAHPSTLPS